MKSVGGSSNTSMTTHREPKNVSRSFMRMKSKLAYFYQDKKTGKCIILQQSDP